MISSEIRIAHKDQRNLRGINRVIITQPNDSKASWRHPVLQ